VGPTLDSDDLKRCTKCGEEKPLAEVLGSPSLPIVGVLALPFPIAAVLRSLLVSVRLLPTAVVLGVLLLPAPHARRALRKAAVLPRAIAAERRYRERRRARLSDAPPDANDG
jgi:hypothetical protein